MINDSGKRGRDHLLKDLVKLHQSLLADEAAGSDTPPPEEAEETVSRFELFVENLPMGVLLADVKRDRYRHPQEYRVRVVNRRFAELVGMERVAILEAPFFAVLPGGREDWGQALEDVALKGRAAQGYSQAPQDGNRLLRVQLFLPRRDTLAVLIEEPAADGADARGSALRRLRLAQAILDSVPLLVCRFRPGGELVYANEAYRRFFDMPSEQLCGHPFVPSIAPEARDFVRSRIELICRDTPSLIYEAPIILASGRRWVQWTDAGVFDGNGILTEYESTGLDITDMKEESLRDARNGALQRDLILYQARRRREFEGSQSVSAKDLKVLSDENRKLKKEVKRLEDLSIHGDLKVCRRCSRINDDEGHWMVPHAFLDLHTTATISGTLCPYCRNKAEGDAVKAPRP